MKEKEEKDLILTGWGLIAYPVAAAVALKALHGAAVVRGVSRQRLPECLESYDGKARRIFILGVGLSGDEPRLAAVLAAQKKRGVKVVWISIIDLTPSQRAVLAPHLETKIYADKTLLEAVGSVFGVDVAGVEPYADENRKKQADQEVAAWWELVDAAMYAHRNYQDDETYAQAIASLAKGESRAAWGDTAKDVVKRYRRNNCRELVGSSACIQKLRERIDRIAKAGDARVLILAESGMGKETVALQIHDKSPRRNELFYAFNCASVTPNLLEDKFFGHEKGAYTGADRQEAGLFDLADKGTLFLDEIGELPLEAQGVLLRVLEGGRFQRVGGRKDISTDVRLVTATHRNLPELVRTGRFRADLFQRLNVVQIRIPPLREHLEDVKDIADNWWFQHHRKRLSDEQVAALKTYAYPGNVRELLNLLERASVLGEEDFTALIREHKEMNAGLFETPADEGAAVSEELAVVVRLHVRKIFDKYGQNLSKTASALKVARNTVRKYV